MITTESGERIPEPICPVNMYFEGDEWQVDPNECDFNIECRMCSESCKRQLVLFN